MVKYQDDGRVTADAATGLSQAEPASRLGPSGFDPSRIAANRKLTTYPEKKVLALAELAADLGILCHIQGFPFGEHRDQRRRK